MSIIQIRQLNATEDLNCVKQQQIHGGERAITIEDAFRGYEKGTNNISGSTGANVAFQYTTPDGDKFVTVVDTEKNVVLGSNPID